MNVALFISGGGTTAEAIIRSSKNGKLQGVISPVVVIASNPQADGIEKAKELDVPVICIEKQYFDTQESYGQAILEKLTDYQVDLVSQNGWLPLTPKNVVEQYNQKIINQHPGPLDPGFPDFGGKGMFGARVICARLIYCIITGEEHPWTETVTHYVTEEFDKGNILRVAILPFEKPERRISKHDIEDNTSVQEYIKNRTMILQEELLPLEHQNVIDTLYSLGQGEQLHYIRDERVVPEEHHMSLTFAKKTAIQLFPQR